MAQRVFISYSHADDEVARSLKELLEQGGATVWLAADLIRPGEPAAESIGRALEESSLVVLLIGRETSEWTRYEWSQALRLASDPEHRKPIVAVVVDDAQAPAFLGEKQFLRVASEDVIRHRWRWPERKELQLWEWQTPPRTKERLADRLSEIGTLASLLDSEPRSAG